MPRIPRDLSGDDVIRALARYGYQPTRQTGSHVRLTTSQRGQHHVTVPRHAALKIGTLNSVLRAVASHRGLTRDEILEDLFP